MGKLNYTEQQKVKNNVLLDHQIFLNHIESKDRPIKTFSDHVNFAKQQANRKEYWGGAAL